MGDEEPHLVLEPPVVMDGDGCVVGEVSQGGDCVLEFSPWEQLGLVEGLDELGEG